MHRLARGATEALATRDTRPMGQFLLAVAGHINLHIGELDARTNETWVPLLLELSNVFEQLAQILDPPDLRAWHLEFKRQGRGRRSDPAAMGAKDETIATKLAEATSRLGKQESAIRELSTRGWCRSRIMAAKRRSSQN